MWIVLFRGMSHLNYLRGRVTLIVIPRGVRTPIWGSSVMGRGSTLHTYEWHWALRADVMGCPHGAVGGGRILHVRTLARGSIRSVVGYRSVMMSLGVFVSRGRILFFRLFGCSCGFRSFGGYRGVCGLSGGGRGFEFLSDCKFLPK